MSLALHLRLGEKGKFQIRCTASLGQMLWEIVHPISAFNSYMKLGKLMQAESDAG